MQPTTLSQPDSTARRVPYEYASPRQLTQALFFAQQALLDNYPHLSWTSWVQALLTVQPDLWVGPQDVTIDQQGLKDVARRLYAYLQAEVTEHPILGPRAPHLGQQLVAYQHQALDALTEIEAQPQVYGPGVFHLVAGRALGDVVAHEVCRAMDPAPYRQPDGVDPKQLRAAGRERVQALRQARGESG